jgi:hypothetical protein
MDLKDLERRLDRLQAMADSTDEALDTEEIIREAEKIMADLRVLVAERKGEGDE